MTRVFISYRRADSSDAAAEIANALRTEDGLRTVEIAVFHDRDSIGPGQDWRREIVSSVRSCDWLVAVIGPGWLAPGSEGKPRLTDRSDMVRVEIAAALAHGVPVLPVILEGAEMPPIAALPRDVAMLTRHEGVRWPTDAETLPPALGRRGKRSAPAIPRGVVGTWAYAGVDEGATYEFSSDRTFSYMGHLQQRTADWTYVFELWEEGVATFGPGRLTLEPFRAEASQRSTDPGRRSYDASPRELVSRSFAWSLSGGSSPVLELRPETGGVTRLELLGVFDQSPLIEP